MPDSDGILVCALADAPRVVPGSVFHHTCQQCHTRLMMAPSGQQLLQQKPELRILCAPCALRVIDGAGIELDLAASKEQISHEVLSAMPNMRRWRN